jgi:hypothetical protein
MGYWLVEAKGKKGALWGFLVQGDRLSRHAVIEQLKLLGNATEISGQRVDITDLNLETVEVRYDATDRHTAGDRFAVDGHHAARRT